jgi:hypothetical protein
MRQQVTIFSDLTQLLYAIVNRFRMISKTCMIEQKLLDDLLKPIQLHPVKNHPGFARRNTANIAGQNSCRHLSSGVFMNCPITAKFLLRLGE